MDELARISRELETVNMHAFKVNDRVLIDPSAFTRAGDSGTITLIYEDMALVRFDDGEQVAFIISDGELILQASMPALAVVTRAEVAR